MILPCEFPSPDIYKYLRVYVMLTLLRLSNGFPVLWYLPFSKLTYFLNRTTTFRLTLMYALMYLRWWLNISPPPLCEWWRCFSISYWISWVIVLSNSQIDWYWSLAIYETGNGDDYLDTWHLAYLLAILVYFCNLFV